MRLFTYLNIMLVVIKAKHFSTMNYNYKIASLYDFNWLQSGQDKIIVRHLTEFETPTSHTMFILWYLIILFVSTCKYICAFIVGGQRPICGQGVKCVKCCCASLFVIHNSIICWKLISAALVPCKNRQLPPLSGWRGHNNLRGPAGVWPNLYLAVCRTDWKSDIGRQNNSEGWGQLNSESTAGGGQQNITLYSYTCS